MCLPRKEIRLWTSTQVLYLAGAFILGFLVAWFAGRSGPKRSKSVASTPTRFSAASMSALAPYRSSKARSKSASPKWNAWGGEGKELNAALQAAQQDAQAAAQAAQAAADEVAQSGQVERDQAQSYCLLLRNRVAAGA